MTCLAWLVASVALAQTPAETWHTVETDHFRVHYPEPAEEWALRAASRIESARALVVETVGYDPPQVTDVLVIDPVATSNAYALPLTTSPRMVLWTTPPPPESVIGHVRDWADELLVHEDTHLVHLLRPSRNGFARLYYGFLGFGPMALKSPRWVSEGYATLVEGERTGSGRPHSDIRASIVRRWAQQGKLPSYGSLAADGSTYMGQSMAYLVGSTYLEWLQDRAGPDSLRHLWARMTARKDRSFDKAFRGVFGDSPRTLYQRFVAEMTRDALLLEDLIEEEQGELWVDLAWYSGWPTLSPDDGQLAMLRSTKKDPPRIVVWNTEVDTEAQERRQEAIDKLLDKDPQDVAAVQTGPPPHKIEHRLHSIGGTAPTQPRWLGDGERMLVIRNVLDGDGVVHKDLFEWTVESGDLRRITRRGDVRDPDPFPDGERAVAVRHTFGVAELVAVDLTTGAVSTLVEGDIDVLWAHPRVSPDGSTLAALSHRGGRWRLFTIDLDTMEEVELDTQGAAFLAHPAWMPDGESLIVSMGQGGLIDLYDFDLQGAAPRRLTHSLSASTAPAITSDGTGVYFLGLEPGGPDLRYLALDPDAVVDEPEHYDPPEARERFEVSGVLRHDPTEAVDPLEVAEVESSPYGLGRQELRLLTGGSSSIDRQFLDFGVRAGDVVGRLDTLVLGGVDFALVEGHQTFLGAAIATSYRGLPVALHLHGYYAPEPGGSGVFRTGGMFGLGADHSWRGGGVGGRAGALVEEFGDVRRTSGFGRLSQSHALIGVNRVLKQRANLGFQVGQSAATPLLTGSHYLARGALGLGIGNRQVMLRLDGIGAAANGPTDTDLLRFGGLGTALLPVDAQRHQVVAPTYEHDAALGTLYHGQVAALDFAGGFELGYARHYVWSGGALPLPMDVLTLRTSQWIEPQPIGKVPGLSVDVGLGYLMDPPVDLEAWRLRAWAAVHYRP